MSESDWTTDDDRARAIYELRVAMKRYLGVNTNGLTDDEVVLILNRRMATFADRMKPILDRLRQAGVIPPEERS